MAVSTTSVRSLLGAREDSEHTQVWVRILICSAILVGFLAYNRGWPDSTPGWICLAMMVVGVVEGIVQFGLILRRPARSDLRRIVGMAYDYTAIPAAMILMDEVFAFAWGLLLWVTVGNGLRYGSRYLFGAVLAAGAGFGAVILSSDYWQAKPGLALGLLAALMAVPLYQAGLLLRSSVETQRMRRASEAKTRFLANMSHELRTPLNTIVVSSELLLSERVTEAERPELAESIHATSQSMMAIVQEVLDLAEIGAGKITVAPEPMDLSGLLSGIERMFRPLAARKGLDLQVGPAPERGCSRDTCKNRSPIAVSRLNSNACAFFAPPQQFGTLLQILRRRPTAPAVRCTQNGERRTSVDPAPLFSQRVLSWTSTARPYSSQ